MTLEDKRKWAVVGTVFELVGSTALVTGSFLIHPVAGWLVLGVICLLYSYGISEAIKKDKKEGK